MRILEQFRYKASIELEYLLRNDWKVRQESVIHVHGGHSHELAFRQGMKFEQYMDSNETRSLEEEVRRLRKEEAIFWDR